jgi:hypothetical protein
LKCAIRNVGIAWFQQQTHSILSEHAQSARTEYQHNSQNMSEQHSSSPSSGGFSGGQGGNSPLTKDLSRKFYDRVVNFETDNLLDKPENWSYWNGDTCNRILSCRKNQKAVAAVTTS